MSYNPREEAQPPPVKDSIADAKQRLAQARKRLDKPGVEHPPVPTVIAAQDFDELYPEET